MIRLLLVACILSLVGLSAKAAYLGPSVQTPVYATVATPNSTLTRPANTTAYAGSSSSPVLIASSTTAGSVVVPSFAITASNGALIPRLTIRTNATTGWGGINLVVTLWTAAPTYTNGDGGAYAVATGSAGQRAQYTCTLAQMGDGAVCQASSAVGSSPLIAPAAGTNVFWDIQVAGAATPISGQTFTLTPEVFN